jgi:hypothetical protein
MIHGIEFGRTLRQPEQLHVELAGQPSGAGCGVAWVLVQQKSHMPSTVMLVDELQERLKILLLLMLTNQKQPLPGAKIHGPKDNSPSIPPRQQNAVRLSSPTPVGTQWRKQQQIGLVLGQKNAARRQTADFSADLTFFSRALDREPRRSAPASIHIQVVAVRAGRCSWKIAGRSPSSADPAATGPSSSQRSTPVRRENDGGRLATIESILQSSEEGGLDDRRPPRTRDQTICYKHESIDEHFADSHATFWRFPQWIALDRTPKLPTFADTDVPLKLTPVPHGQNKLGHPKPPSRFRMPFYERPTPV